MKKINFFLRAFCTLLVLVGLGTRAWAQVSTATITDGKDYVIAVYSNSKYIALPLVNAAGTPAGVEVTLNSAGKVTPAAGVPVWTATASSGDFKLSYQDAGDNTQYLYKNGTGNTNYNLNKNTTGNTWNFSKSTNGNTYSVKANRGSSNTILKYDNNAWKVSGTTASYSIILLEVGSDSGDDPSGDDLSIVDFESETSAYTGWTFTNITTKKTDSSVPAHGGSYFGTTNGQATGSIKTKSKVNPGTITFYISKTTTNSTSSSWKVQTSTNGTSWTDAKTVSASSVTRGEWTEVTHTFSDVSDVYVRVYYDGSTAVRCIDDLTLTLAGDPDPEKTVTSISVTGTPETFWKGDTFNHNGMTVTATYDDETNGNVTSSAEFSTPDMSTPGAKTVTVTYQGQTDTYEITVQTIANTQETAYTVAQAKTIIDAGKDLATEVYVAGKISQIDSYNETYHSITYWISADGTTTNQFEVYSGKNLNNTDFDAIDDIVLGADVVIYGVIKKYNSTYEFDKNNYLVSYTAAPAKPTPELSFSPAEYEITEGDDFVAPTLTNPQDVAVTYAASDVTPASCIEVAADGTVTINGAGSATITASFAGNGEYNPASASYTLTVNEAVDPNLAYTFDFTVNNFGLPTSAVKNQEKAYTYDGKTIKLYGDATNGFKFNSSYLIMGKEGAYLTLPAFAFAVKKIVVVGNTGASGKVTQNIFVGETTVSTATTGATETYTYAINENYQAAGNVYTLKVTNANNTQITKIYIYKNPDAPVVPTLVVPESLTLEANATSGEFAYTISNPDESVLAAAVNPEATWVSNVAIDDVNKKITFNTTANGPAAAREATITVTYGSIQKEVTITQKREVLDHVVLPFNVAAGTTGAALKEMDGISCKIDGSDYNNETHKIKLSANTHYVQVKTNERIGVCTFSFCGLASAGSSSFKLQESTDGTNWTDVEDFTITFEAKNDVVEWASTNAFSADARYMKLAFLKLTDEVNCGLGAFSIAQYVAPAPEYGEVAMVATSGNDNYYATFSCNRAVIFDAEQMMEIQTVSILDGGLVFNTESDNSAVEVTDNTVDGGWVAGYYVPANTGVLVYSVTSDPVRYYYVKDNVENYYEEIDGDNMLRAASVAMTGDYKFYKLAYGDWTNKTGLGFYYGAEGGAAFTAKDGGAYLAVPSSMGLKSSFLFAEEEEGITTDVEHLILDLSNGTIYDLMGRVVVRPVSGHIYIQNGEKYLAK